MMPGEFIAPARCNGCQEIFPSKNQAEEHARRAGHWSYKCITRVCTQCMKTFAKNEDQQQHMNATGHMKVERQGSLNGYPFVGADVTSHRQLSHAVPTSTQGMVSVACPNCRAQFPNSAELVTHVTKTESCSTCKICLQPFETLDEHYWDSKAHPKCNPCCKGFENQQALAAHKKECSIAPSKPSNKKPSDKALGKAPMTYNPSNIRPSDKALGKAPMTCNSSNIRANTPSLSAQMALNSPSSSRQTLGGTWTRRANGHDGASPLASWKPLTSTAPDHVASPASPAPSLWGRSASAGTSSDGSAVPSARGTPKSTGSDSFGPPAQPASAWEDPTSASPGDDDAQAWKPQRPTGSDDVRSPSPANWAAMLAPSPEPEESGRSSVGPRSSAATVFESARGTPDQDGAGSSVVESPSPTVSVAGAHDALSSTASLGAVRSQDTGHRQLARVANGAKNGNPSKHLKSQPNANAYSWHCRSCLGPCVEPVTTKCGHLMCFECAMRELRANLGCPVCKTVFLIRLAM
ncbi:hypothetical protein K466DRAFT_659432 [Polyporus arcularius HHB13444]|uniref:RING-type domain-containing protein n=1 Tax=Polyporus arcularius HHB13444 TaxID=1314778 RepID=A0A5C3PUD0_9APHY|nr:hypothetical protein K466DRAFT_659432 [Polyporus arcularius HHB13444]